MRAVCGEVHYRGQIYPVAARINALLLDKHATASSPPPCLSGQLRGFQGPSLPRDTETVRERMRQTERPGDPQRDRVLSFCV